MKKLLPILLALCSMPALAQIPIEVDQDYNDKPCAAAAKVMTGLIEQNRSYRIITDKSRRRVRIKISAVSGGNTTVIIGILTITPGQRAGHLLMHAAYGSVTGGGTLDRRIRKAGTVRKIYDSLLVKYRIVDQLNYIMENSTPAGKMEELETLRAKARQMFDPVQPGADVPGLPTF